MCFFLKPWIDNFYGLLRKQNKTLKHSLNSCYMCKMLRRSRIEFRAQPWESLRTYPLSPSEPPTSWAYGGAKFANQVEFAKNRAWEIKNPTNAPIWLHLTLFEKKKSRIQCVLISAHIMTWNNPASFQKMDEKNKRLHGIDRYFYVRDLQPEVGSTL